jgi:chromosome segregation ATPase
MALPHSSLAWLWDFYRRSTDRPRAHLDQITTETDAAQARLEGLAAQIAMQQKALNDANGALAAAQATSAHAKAEAEDLTTQIATRRSALQRLTEAEQALITLQAQMDAVKTDLATKAPELAQARNDLAAAQSELASARDQLAENQGRAGALAQQTALAESAKTVLEATIAGLKLLISIEK